MNASAAHRRKFVNIFKQRGLSLQVSALDALAEGYAAATAARAETPNPESDDNDNATATATAAATLSDPRQYAESIISALFDHLSDHDDAGVVTKTAVLAAVERVAVGAQRRSTRMQSRRPRASEGAPDAPADIQIIDAFAINPRSRNQGIASSAQRTGHAIIDATPETKAQVFRSRFELMFQKTLRNPRFTPPATSATFRPHTGQDKNPYLQLTAVDSLSAQGGRDALVMGMLTQLEDNCWFLEDLQGKIKLDLSEAHATAGLHTDSSFVIAQGRLIVDPKGGDANPSVFKVFAMGSPPAEKRADSIAALGKNAHIFDMQVWDDEALLDLERDNTDAMFLFLSDVFLDQPHVVGGVRSILRGYAEDKICPTIIVLMGNFLSHPFGQHWTDPSELTSHFTELGKMIAADFPNIAQTCTFIVVPGPNDAGPGNILPRPPMPQSITNGFVEALGADRVVLSSNPCRLRYLTQEIVIFRDDLLRKMIRHCAVRPDVADSGVMAEHFVKSIIDQAHLCPLPLTSRPIYWAHDQALWLLPTPHVVVVADQGDGYSFNYGGAIGLNPGSFGRDKSFCLYAPAARASEMCALPQ